MQSILPFSPVTSSAQNTLNKQVSIIDSYSKIIEVIDNVMHMVEPFYPRLSEFRSVISFIGDVTTSFKDNINVYIPIGNFHFLSENVNENHVFSCDMLDDLEQCMQVNYQKNSSKVNPDWHALSHYGKMLRKNGNLPFGNYHPSLYPSQAFMQSHMLVGK